MDAGLSGGLMSDGPIAVNYTDGRLSDHQANRQMIGMWEVTIDPDSETVDINPVDRSSAYHFPLSNYYGNVVSIVDYEFTPEFYADIMIKHPMPNSGINGYDPRVIAILPANAGVSMNYPLLDVVANNRAVMNPDGYTKLWDSTTLPGNANPFLAYFKDSEYRAWHSTGNISETRRWYLNLNGFGGPLQFYLVVDVSTSYPSPDDPPWCNAGEPVSINAVSLGGLSECGGFGYIDAEILDWQGTDNTLVYVETPDIYNDIVQLDYTEPGADPHTYKYWFTVENVKNAPSGVYHGLIRGYDTVTRDAIFREFEYEIGFTPAIVRNVPTPGSARSVFVNWNYAYVCDGDLRVINLTDPESAFIEKTIATPGYANEVYCTDDYAYVADFNPFNGGDSFLIIDKWPLDTATIIKSITMQAYDVCVDGDLAYVGDWGQRLAVVDINPPASASVVGSVNGIIEIENVYKFGNYVYVTDTQAQMHIINVQTPSSPYIAKTVALNGIGTCIYANNEYAYVSDSNGLEIIDILPYYNAYIMDTIETANYPSRASGVSSWENYAFMSDGHIGLHIICVDPINDAYIESTFSTPGWAMDVAMYISYAPYVLVADSSNGLEIIKLAE